MIVGMNPKIRNILSTSLVISLSCVFLIGPIPLITSILSSFAVIEYRNSYQYESATSLYLEIDMGNIELVYVDHTDYNAEIELSIQMSGAGLAEKNCLDYLFIEEGNLNEPDSFFSVISLPELRISESITTNITIRVILRKNMVYNISTNVRVGNVNYRIPFGVNVQNLVANVSEGEILFDLSYCTLDGNITGIGNHSNIEIRSEDVKCSKNIYWVLSNRVGMLLFNITQSIKMGWNITAIGDIQSSSAWSEVDYNDITSQVGSVLTLYNWHSTFPSRCTWTGFNYSSIGIPPNGYIFTSLDYPSENVFNISLNSSIPLFQPYFWNLYSEPIEL